MQCHHSESWRNHPSKYKTFFLRDIFINVCLNAPDRCCKSSSQLRRELTFTNFHDASSLKSISYIDMLEGVFSKSMMAIKTPKEPSVRIICKSTQKL